MSKEDPAFVLIDQTVSWSVKGPDGLVWMSSDYKDVAETSVRLLDLAFDAGRSYERRKAEAVNVPGPQSPPRPIHPREVG